MKYVVRYRDYYAAKEGTWTRNVKLAIRFDTYTDARKLAARYRGIVERDN